MPTLVGIGSLLSKESAERSFEVSNFRKGRLDGWRRIFNLVGVTSIRAGRANLETGEIAALAASKNEKSSILVSLFDVSEDSMVNYYIREQRYLHKKVLVKEDDGNHIEAIICCESTDEQYFDISCKGDQEVFDDIVGNHWNGPIWYNFPNGPPPDLNPPTVYPIRPYVRLCLSGAEYLDIMDCFLDNTFLFDGRTLRQYLLDNPEIAEETKSHHSKESDNLKFNTPHPIKS